MNHRIFLFVLISTIFFACEEEVAEVQDITNTNKQGPCHLKSLESIDCGVNYTLVNHTQYELNYGHNYRYDIQVNHRYDNQVDYDSLDTITKSNLTIDFSISTLLGISITTNPNNRIIHQTYVCQDSNGVNYNVEYSLQGQCNGSGLMNMDLTFWTVIPKLDSSVIVHFNVQDINPF